jgi:hypothetical protein
MYFSDGGLTAGPSTSIAIELVPTQPPFAGFQMGFTRGYLSSQAYAHLFHNAPVAPTPKSIDYDTGAYQPQYQWLGYDARKLVFDFLNEALNDPAITLDVLAFDLDEPDVIRALQQLGGRLRIFMDDSPLHTKSGAMELEAKARFVTSAGAGNVKTGHFHRFAHCKVMIQKKNGTPVKVLTGSANFSVRGLYVQANNILVFDDPATAQLYEQAFEQSFTAASGFSKASIAQQWFDLPREQLPPAAVCFSPHSSPDISLSRVASAIQQAQNSVLYAIMELQGSGPVLDDIKALGANPKIFGYGITQSDKGMTVYKPGAPNGVLTEFSFLNKQVPANFQQEYSGGMGQVIHDKFVVVDFNGPHPWVFTGSSNLAAGGEAANGDNLLAINDPAVAVAYGVEAIRLVDHYDFRSVMQSATATQPLTLQPDSANWWAPYYDPSNARSTERTLLCRGVAAPAP